MLASRRTTLLATRQRLQEHVRTWLSSRRRAMDAGHRGLHERLGRRLQRTRVDLEARGATLNAVAPQAVLERGFSLTCSADGTVVRSSESITPGTPIVTTLASGRLESTVDAVDTGDDQVSGTVGPS